MSNTDPRDLFISANPLGLSRAELVKDTSGFVDDRTHGAYLVFKAGFDAGQPAEQSQGEPVYEREDEHLKAVEARLVASFNNPDGEERLEALAYWLDQQHFRPDILSIAAADLRSLYRRTKENEHE